jgi:acetyltransferase-like isoleucine patch superfamily enzyme
MHRVNDRRASSPSYPKGTNIEKRLRRLVKLYVVLPLANSLITAHTVFGPRERLNVHETARVQNAFFNTGGGTIVVDQFAFFGFHVSILAGGHDSRLLGASRQDSTPQRGYDVWIKEGAWIASNAIIIGPCVVGANAVIGAGSVVTSDVPDHALVIGNPARILRQN